MNYRSSLKSISDTVGKQHFCYPPFLLMSFQCKVKLQQLYLNCFDILNSAPSLVSFFIHLSENQQGMKRKRVGENIMRKTYSNNFFIPSFCPKEHSVALEVKKENLIRVKNTCLQQKKEIK